MENEAKFQVPTWNQIYAILRNQNEKTRHREIKPDAIVGVTRDGWGPVRILPDILGICAPSTTLIEFYEGVAEPRNELVLTQGVSADVTGKKALLVNDIMDTGKSLKLAREHLQNQGVTEVRISALYYKPSSLFKSDFYENKTRRWVIFPWDTKETIRKILEKRGDNSISVEDAKLVKAGLLEKLAGVPEGKV